MNNANKVIILIILVTLLASCKPSEQAIQIALQQTQTAIATNTHTPEPTSTFTPIPTSTPTQTPTETPTEIPTDIPTATPTMTSTPDLRVITIESKEFMLTKEDLPQDGRYYLPHESWISPHHNAEVIQDWGKEEGLIYLEKTGRIDGWWVYYDRGNSTIRAPEEIFHNIIQYKTAEGAQLSLTEYGTRVDDPEYSVVESDTVLGDGTVIYVRKTMQNNGEYRTWYVVETTYRNYVSIVGGWGWDKDFDLEYVIEIARIAMDKIMAAPLGNW